MSRNSDIHDKELSGYSMRGDSFVRRETEEVRIGAYRIGGGNPVAVQTMTDTDTNDTAACMAQIERIYAQGGRIVRLTAQGEREGENLRNIVARVSERFGNEVALVADIHFMPKVASVAAKYVDKVRINPGNYNDRGGEFEALLKQCAERGVAIRIGVNHGSLSQRIVELYGDTPTGMVESAMEFLRVCHLNGFADVAVSMKSSNTRVMVQAYRLLVHTMERESMRYPLHLGVTEAGNGDEGRVKSAVGIGALLADGIGDTIRVSLTAPPEEEIPVGKTLAAYFEQRAALCETAPADELTRALPFDPFNYARRMTDAIGRLGNGAIPLLYGELNGEEMAAVNDGRIAVLTSTAPNPVGDWREMIARMGAEGDRRPVILHRKYPKSSREKFLIHAAADFGVMFIDGLADGIWLEYEGKDNTDSAAFDILQASRARMSKTEYIACPGCGRTLYALQQTLEAIKARTSHLAGLKIGVMGCIVNGPGEMADADYGYVGSVPGKVTLYRGQEPVRRNVAQEEALDALIDLLKTDGKWVEPQEL